jgi:WD40 repeat protein
VSPARVAEAKQLVPFTPRPGADLFGDPLPAGAVARMGSDRLRDPHPPSMWGIRGAGFSGGGSRIATLSVTSGLRLWDAQTGKLLHEAQLRERGIHAVSVASGGRFLAAAGAGAVALWDLDAAPPVERSLGEASGAGATTPVAVSARGRFVAAGLGRSVLLWDAATPAAPRKLEGHGGAVAALDFAPDERSLASAGQDGVVALWDVERGTRSAAVPSGHKRIFNVAWSPSADALLMAYGEGMRLWDARRLRFAWDYRAASGEAGSLAAFEGAGTARWHTGLAFAPDGRVVAVWPGQCRSCSGLHLHSARTGGLVRSLRPRAPVVSASFSFDGRRLLGASDGAVTLWQMATGREVRYYERHDEQVNDLAFSPDGAVLASASHDRTVRLWDARTGKPLRTIRGHGAAVRSVDFSADGGRLLSAGGRSVRLWDARTGAPLEVVPHPSNVTLAAYLPGGKAFATVTQIPARVRVFDAKTFEVTWALELGGIHYAGWSAAIDRTSGRLAVQTADRAVQVLDLIARRFVRSIEAPDDVSDLALARGGRWLAVGLRPQAQQGHEALLYDLESGTALPDRIDAGHCFAFSPDAAWLATGPVGGPRLVELTTRRSTSAAQGQPGILAVLHYSPDGRWLATAGTDGTILVWDVAELAKR